MTHTPLRLLAASTVLSFGCAPLNQMQPSIANGGRTVAVAVDPGNSKNIVVVSESGGIFRSADSGATWSQTSGKGTFWYNDVTHLPSNPSVIIAAANADTRSTTGGGIWRSADSGGSWSRVSVTPPTAGCAADFSAYGLAAETARSRVWAGTSCGAAYSDDSGATWTFLATAPGYANDKVYAVLAPTTTRIVILTDDGVKVSTNSGGAWSSSSAGLPSYVLKGVHNQIAVSPFEPSHLYWAFNYWSWNVSAAQWDGHIALYRSLDGGASWSAILDNVGINRPPFVKVAKAASDAAQYDLHFGDGSCTLERATVTHSATPTLSAWTFSSLDHCDPADLGVSSADGKTPLLLASDGGVHRTSDGGASWTLTGAGKGGYAALQITEVIGQLHGDRESSDLYFATQDNDIWSSPDGGASWPANRCCEGFFLNLWREPLPASDTKLTGVSCWGCGNFISGPALAGQGPFPDPPNNAGNPRLLKPACYISSTAISGLSASVFDLTTDTGATWTPRYGFPEEVRDLPKVAGPAADPVVYTAVKLPGATVDGNEIVGIKRVSGVLGSGSPLVSNVGGIGSLGIFPTMFAWYKPFGVDPNDPNYLIVPDIVDSTVKISQDAGATWTPDATLTNLATQGGTFKFRWGAFSQISAFGFDPDCAGHVLVGTQQAGIVETFDRGTTWQAVKDSDHIPSVSAFYFQGSEQVVISSYGRGLWKYSYSCPKKPIGPIVKLAQLAEPTIYWKGARVPISQIHDPDVCPVCGFFITTGGDVADVAVDPASGEVREVSLDGGHIRGVTFDRKVVEPPFRVAQVRGLGQFGGDKRLLALLQAGAHVKGLYLEGRKLKGFILATTDIREDELPRKMPLGPHIVVDVRRGSEGAGRRMAAVVVRGAGFDPHRPITISVDGKPIKLDVPPRFDEKGDFSVAIPPTVGIGGHTVLVEQRGERGVIRDATTFIITVQDFPHEKR